jgi:hypothetical protein
LNLDVLDLTANATEVHSVEVRNLNVALALGISKRRRSPWHVGVIITFTKEAFSEVGVKLGEPLA